MLELPEALQQILAAIQPLPPETIPLAAAVGRVLAEPVVAPFDLPRFDNSAMDGYAVRAEDVLRANAASPVVLRVIGAVAAGGTAARALEPGTCLRVFTGSPIPSGADAVVMQEDTRPMPDQPDHIGVIEGIRPLEHVRLRGEDIKQGAVVLAAGERLSAGGVGVVAALGREQVQVGRRPAVAVLSTGSELVDPGRALGAGKIYESNRPALGALLRAVAAEPHLLPLVPDELEATRAALENALATSDAVISTGGASVGDLDFVKRAFEAVGGTLEFWQLAIRPGKPFVFGRWRDKCFFGLPGNPVSAFVTFLLLVRPALLHLQGAAHLEPPAHPGLLVDSLRNEGSRRHFMRVTVDAQGNVTSAGRQGSHVLSSLARANGLVDVPPHRTLLSGTTVPVLRWE